MNKNMIKKNSHRSELLLPAGSLDKLKTAILYGADAVYAGTPDMSLRTKSSFALDEIQEGVEFVHNKNKKIYLTLNLFTHNKDIEKLPEYISTLKKINVDGVIVADPGVFSLIKKEIPNLELHISTQANICSWLSVDFWHKQGAALCVMAREVSFEELKTIREKCSNIKLEIFIHGSMCMTYSGRCLLSNFLSDRGANQGNCSNSCRWQYKLKMKLKDGSEKEFEINKHNMDMFDFFLEENTRPGELLPFEEDVHGSYILNSKDLCLMPKLNQYLALGIDSLKIEGRNKTQYYAGITARSYRNAIDDYYNDPDNWNCKKYLQELNTIQSRGYTLAFHEGNLTNLAHNYDSLKSIANYEYAGYISEWNSDSLIFITRNIIRSGDILEFVIPNSDDVILLRMYEFIHANTEEKKQTIQGAQHFPCKIPLTHFHNEDQTKLRNILPKFTLIRKTKFVDPIYIERIRLDRIAYKIENEQSNIGNLYYKQQDKLQKLLNSDNKTKRNKTLKTTGACCGKGCNGCLIFWNNPEYENARKILQKKKTGQRLTNEEIVELKKATLESKLVD